MFKMFAKKAGFLKLILGIILAGFVFTSMPIKGYAGLGNSDKLRAPGISGDTNRKKIDEFKKRIIEAKIDEGENLSKAIILWFSQINKNNIDKVGGKNANLGEMTQKIKEISVPYGFAVTTEAFKLFINEGKVEVPGKMQKTGRNIDVSFADFIKRTIAKLNNYENFDSVEFPEVLNDLGKIEGLFTKLAQGDTIEIDEKITEKINLPIKDFIFREMAKLEKYKNTDSPDFKKALGDFTKAEELLKEMAQGNEATVEIEEKIILKSEVPITEFIDIMTARLEKHKQPDSEDFNKGLARLNDARDQLKNQGNKIKVEIEQEVATKTPIPINEFINRTTAQLKEHHNKFDSPEFAQALKDLKQILGLLKAPEGDKAIVEAEREVVRKTQIPINEFINRAIAKLKAQDKKFASPEFTQILKDLNRASEILESKAGVFNNEMIAIAEEATEKIKISLKEFIARRLAKLTENDYNDVETLWQVEEDIRSAIGLAEMPQAVRVAIVQGYKQLCELLGASGTVAKEDFTGIVDDVEGLFQNLIVNGYIDETGVIQDKFRALKVYSDMKLDNRYVNRKKAIYDILNQISVAVRSSATAEDLPEASFAGQQDTYLNMRGEEQVIGGVKNDWASLYNFRAIGYRHTHKVPHDTAYLSVVIQEMVDAKAAGTGFSVFVENGFPGVIIDAAWGLGEAVVSGSTNPDRYYIVFDHLTGEPKIARKVKGDKKRKVVYREGGAKKAKEGTELVETTLKEQQSFSLNDKEALELARAIMAIQKHYGMIMDVEWAVNKKGEVKILQARPDTVWNKKRKISPFLIAKSNKIVPEEVKKKAVKEGRLLLQGVAGGGLGVGFGKAVNINSELSGKALTKELNKVQEGDVIVCKMTKPDMVTAMKKAAAIICDEGGLTCHAAIVCRELGNKPFVVGARDARKGLLGATEVLEDGMDVTVDSNDGRVYLSKLETEELKNDIDIRDVKRTKTKIKIIAATSDVALPLWLLSEIKSYGGNGLMRSEVLHNTKIIVHPLAGLAYDWYQNPEFRKNNPEKGKWIKENIIDDGTVRKHDFSGLGVNVDDLFENLIENGYIDQNGIFQAKFEEVIKEGVIKKYPEMTLGAIYEGKKEQIYTILKERHDEDLRTTIEMLAKDYGSFAEFYKQTQFSEIALNASAQRNGSRLTLRTLDFKTNEIRNQKGGHLFERFEDNPMMEYRGVLRMLSDEYLEAFTLDVDSYILASQVQNNIDIMFPVVRTPEELKEIIDFCAKRGLVRGKNGIRFFAMIETAASVLQIDEFLELVDGVSVGSNDLTQYTLGFGRDNKKMQRHFNEANPAILKALEITYKAVASYNAVEANLQKKEGSICGNRPSYDPAFGRHLVRAGATSISVLPESIQKLSEVIFAAEKELESEGAKFDPNVAGWKIPAKDGQPERGKFAQVAMSDIIQRVGVHPRLLLEYYHNENLDDTVVAAIKEKLDGSDVKDLFVYLIYSKLMAKIQATPDETSVIIATDDLITTAYKALIGGELKDASGVDLEEFDENPLLGFAGLVRVTDKEYKELFSWMLEAFKKAKQDSGRKNLGILFKLVHTLDDVKKASEILAEQGLVPGEDGLLVGMEIATPANVLSINEFIQEGHFNFLTENLERFLMYDLPMNPGNPLVKIPLARQVNALTNPRRVWTAAAENNNVAILKNIAEPVWFEDNLEAYKYFKQGYGYVTFIVDSLKHVKDIQGAVVIGANAIFENPATILALSELQGVNAGFKIVVWANDQATVGQLKKLGVGKVADIITAEGIDAAIGAVRKQVEGIKNTNIVVINSPVDFDVIEKELGLNKEKFLKSFDFSAPESLLASRRGIQAINLQTPNAKEGKINNMVFTIRNAVARALQKEPVVKQYKDLNQEFVKNNQISKEELGVINNLDSLVSEIPLFKVTEESAKAQAAYEIALEAVSISG